MLVHDTTIFGRTAREIAASIEGAVRAERLRPGNRLPPVRRLAAALEVSPGTVASAYRTMQRRGVLTARAGAGTRVSLVPPVGASLPAATPPGVRDLAAGGPDPALLPSLTTAMRRIDVSPRLYDEPADLPELVDLAARRFRAEGVPTGPVTVVSGALDGVERILEAHLRPGDRVAVEDPAFAAVLDLIRALGLVPEPVAVDDRGMQPEGLERGMAAGVEAVIVTPRSQNPFGAALDAGRARELREVLAARPEVLVVEDDHQGPVAGTDLHPLVESERPRWAVVHSVAKSLGPDLRVAVVTGDPVTVARVSGRRLLGPGWVSRLLQLLVVSLWEDPATAGLLQRAAATYHERRTELLEELAGHGIAAHGRSGLNVWIPVREETRTVQLLLQAGWAVRAGEPFRLRAAPAVRVSIATLRSAEAARLASDLDRILGSAGASRPT